MTRKRTQISTWTSTLGLVLFSSLCLAPDSAGQVGLQRWAVPNGSGNLTPRSSGMATVRMASGLNRPIFATHAPGDTTRLFIVEQRGVIKILDLSTFVVNATSFLDIDSLVAGPSSSGDERGLLGLAFHPEYSDNGLFYVNYTNNSSDTRIVEYKVSANPDVADPGSARTVMSIDQPQTNHNGGWIGFSPIDDLLYIATGDGGGACDSGSGHTSGVGNSQDITDNLLGKMLRIDPLGTNGPGGNYGIPASNPFVGVTGDDEIWSYGLRNPWRSSFDRNTGDLYMADVGQGAREEINFQPSTSTGGENYGWRCMEGNGCGSASGCSGSSACTCGSASLTDPVHFYARSLGRSISGGYAYRGREVPAIRGDYIFADYAINNIWRMTVQGGVMTDLENITSDLSPSVGGFTLNQVASFGEDANGELYVVDRGSTSSGQIFKVIRW